MSKFGWFRMGEVTPRFMKDEKGLIAIFAGVAIPIVLAIGGGMIDYSSLLSKKQKVQSSLDSAVLSGLQYAEGHTEDQLKKYMLNAFRTNMGADSALVDTPSFTIGADDGSIEGRVSGKSPSTFLKFVGYDTFKFSVISRIDGSPKLDKLDIVFAIDHGQTPQAVPYAIMKRFIDVAFRPYEGLQGQNGVHPTLSIGFVPYGSGVRLDPDKFMNASWLDKNALSPVHSENFSSPINRFTLLKALGTSWKGCVEVRPQPYDVHDFDPSAAQMHPDEIALKTDRNARFFVPWFANDVPDPGSPTAFTGLAYPNYLGDGKVPSGKNTLPLGYDPKVFPLGGAQADTLSNMANPAKYNRLSLLANSNTDRMPKADMPNDLCIFDMPYVLQDFDNQADRLRKNLDAVITDLPKRSLSTTLEGLTWAWRMLSDGEPFTNGRRDARKIIVLSTDNRQTDPTHESFDYAPYGNYGPFGYPIMNRLRIDPALVPLSTGPGKAKQQGPQARINKLHERFLRACEHAKKAGIEIFAFYVPDPEPATLDQYFNQAPSLREQRDLDVLKQCLSSPDHFFPIDDSTAKGRSEAQKFYDLIKKQAPKAGKRKGFLSK